VKLPVLGALMLLFVFLLGVYVAVSVFASPAHQTLTVSIYEAIRGAELNAPFGAAQAVVLLTVAALFLAASSGLARLAERRA
jgi:putative spermidine/putrescine transport system permease protein